MNEALYQFIRGYESRRSAFINENYSRKRSWIHRALLLDVDFNSPDVLEKEAGFFIGLQKELAATKSGKGQAALAARGLMLRTDYIATRADIYTSITVVLSAAVVLVTTVMPATDVFRLLVVGGLLFAVGAASYLRIMDRQQVARTQELVRILEEFEKSHAR